MNSQKVIVGTRGSKLALTQTNLILEEIKRLNPDVSFEIKIIKTKGDAGQVNNVGAFIKEIELALLNKEIDIAVHSLKDMPTEEPEGLIIAAITEREDVRDVLISKDNLCLKDLPSGAVIGTGSPRRIAQLKKMRNDLNIKYIQGNVDSRLQKMKDGEYDAIVLAAAGLSRLSMKNVVTEYLSIDDMVPAVGQGALAIQIREGEGEIKDIVGKVDHQPTREAVLPERYILSSLGGGCRAPIAAYAKVEGDKISIQGMYADESYGNLKKSNVNGEKKESIALAEQLSKQLRD